MIHTLTCVQGMEGLVFLYTGIYVKVDPMLEYINVPSNGRFSNCDTDVAIGSS